VERGIHSAGPCPKYKRFPPSNFTWKRGGLVVGVASFFGWGTVSLAGRFGQLLCFCLVMLGLLSSGLDDYPARAAGRSTALRPLGHRRHALVYFWLFACHGRNCLVPFEITRTLRNRVGLDYKLTKVHQVRREIASSFQSSTLQNEYART
jgi:hypothetical protein